MNLDTYTTEMSKSMNDKNFFIYDLHRKGVNCVIDFGCADGALIRDMIALCPKVTYIGYDISKELISYARRITPYNGNTIFFDGDVSIEYFCNFVKTLEYDKLAINFSSVLHEVFSSTGGKGTIKYMINELQPDYITIRDMYCLNNYSIDGVPEEVYNNIIYRGELYYLKEFQERYPITSWVDLMHLLMKLPWKNNGWEDELEEDYFSWSLTDFLELAPNYEINKLHCYALPYLVNKWRDEYGLELPDDIYTHAQIILRRRK